MVHSALGQTIDLYHQALSELIRGNCGPQKARFSHHDDACLANPFGPPVTGWEHVEAMLDRVAALYIDAGPKQFERVATYVTTDLACIVEIERAWVSIRGHGQPGEVALRVTTVFRLEAGGWKVVHRHADSITAPRPPETVLQ